VTEQKSQVLRWSVRSAASLRRGQCEVKRVRSLLCRRFSGFRDRLSRAVLTPSHLRRVPGNRRCWRRPATRDVCVVRDDTEVLPVLRAPARQRPGRLHAVVRWDERMRRKVLLLLRVFVRAVVFPVIFYISIIIVSLAHDVTIGLSLLFY